MLTYMLHSNNGSSFVTRKTVVRIRYVASSKSFIAKSAFFQYKTFHRLCGMKWSTCISLQSIFRPQYAQCPSYLLQTCSRIFLGKVTIFLRNPATQRSRVLIHFINVMQMIVRFKIEPMINTRQKQNTYNPQYTTKEDSR